MHKFSWTNIVRHQRVKHQASPDDPALAEYWAWRRGKTPLPIDRTAQRLHRAQGGRCAICKAAILPVEDRPQTPHEWEAWLATIRKTIDVTWNHGTSDHAGPRLLHLRCYPGNGPHLLPAQPPPGLPEPDAVKAARPVLRGAGHRKVSGLPDECSTAFSRVGEHVQFGYVERRVGMAVLARGRDVHGSAGTVRSDPHSDDRRRRRRHSVARVPDPLVAVAALAIGGDAHLPRKRGGMPPCRRRDARVALRECRSVEARRSECSCSLRQTHRGCCNSINFALWRPPFELPQFALPGTLVERGRGCSLPGVRMIRAGVLGLVELAVR
jgi:hypothetical protein